MKLLSFRSLRSHSWYVGLAFAALLGQLSLVTLSAAHQAQMLAAGASAVCTVRSGDRLADESPQGDARIQGNAGCVVCAAAATALVAGESCTAPLLALDFAPQPGLAASALPHRTARLRPPVRAPPAAA